MIRLVVAVYDSASATFGQPFYVSARPQAIRAFTDEVNRSAADNDLYKHPEDFILYALSEYDDSTGRFSSFGEPEALLRGKDAVIKAN